MSDQFNAGGPENGGLFTIGAPSEYAGGHAAIGVVTFLEASLPIILYYAW